MIHTNFNPFPILTTDRLVLRQLDPADAPAIFAHRSDPKVITYLENFPHPSVEESRAFIERVNSEIALGKSILWVLTEKGNNQYLGSVCLWNINPEQAKAETGYTLDSRFHRKGLMNEALEKIIEFGFGTVQLQSIEAYTHWQNEGSIRLLQKQKFVQEPGPKKDVSDNRVCFTLNREQAGF